MAINKRHKIIFSLLVILIAVSPAILFRKQKQPALNVILITVDSLRQDHLGCYGYKLDTSPHIDKFAKEAVTFTQGIAQGSKTPLALPSLHTSTYPRTHGVYREGQRLNPAIPTLAQILRKNDYLTAAIVSYPPVVKGLELDRGFDLYVNKGIINADLVTQIAVSWLEKNHNNKFFLWLHYWDPHNPYRSPSPYNRMFMDKFELGRRHVPVNDKMYNGFKGIPSYMAEANITDVDYYISQYDAEIRFTDEQIAVLLNKLRELSLDKKSIIIITADHGEMLGEHEHYFWHNTLYEEIIKVPLFIKCERIMPLSKVIKEQVQAIDIAPTILAILELPKYKHMQGNSLLPLIFGKKGRPSAFAFSEHTRPKDNFIRECVRGNGWKLIYTKQNDNEDYELYNLSLDPAESKNLVSKEREEFKFLNDKLDRWRKRIPLNESTFNYQLTEEAKRVLENLGYLQ